MQEFTIPDIMFQDVEIPNIHIQYYESDGSAVKNRIHFTQNLFSFVLEGEKVVHHRQKAMMISPNEFILVQSSNCLMTERLSNGGQYKSLLLFFSNQVLDDFRLKYADILSRNSSDYQTINEIIELKHDDYSNSYVNALYTIYTSKSFYSDELFQLKFEEILLYLLDRNPVEMNLFLKQNSIDQEQMVKSIVGNNIFSNLTIKELSFLCNMSISTFKRFFYKIYQTSPQKWILAEKMRIAQLLISSGKKPIQIFNEMGYISSSNFSKAYKSYFGFAPLENLKELKNN